METFVMLEALWSVEFVTNVQSSGAGVAVLETGRVLGGDGQYFYVGSYRIQNSQVQAQLKVTHYAGLPNSVFGSMKEFELDLIGIPARDRFELHGHVAADPNLMIGIRLTRRAELP